MFKIDINCDMGEGMGNEELLMPFISSCSIACGGHVGSEETILRTLQLAKAYDVKVGPHPSYPDPDNFGRTSMNLSKKDLKDSLERQISLFKLCCKKTETNINHIKPHGALYNDLFVNAERVNIFLEVVKKQLPQVQIYCAPGSLLEKEALIVGIKTKREGFMDRAYNGDGTLRSRLLHGAILTDFEQVGFQVLGLIKKGSVSIANDESLTLSVQTLCLHGDHPQASKLIKHIDLLLKKEDIDVR